MTYVVRNKEKPDIDHEVVDVTDTGNYVTKCQLLIMGGEHSVVFQDTTVNCQNCKSPPVYVPVPRKPRAPNARPQHRTARNRHQEMLQGLRFAQKAVTAALEWAARGEQLQFLDQSLDQTHMAYRFLKEILEDHGRLQDDSLLDGE